MLTALTTDWLPAPLSKTLFIYLYILFSARRATRRFWNWIWPTTGWGETGENASVTCSPKTATSPTLWVVFKMQQDLNNLLPSPEMTPYDNALLTCPGHCETDLKRDPQIGEMWPQYLGTNFCLVLNKGTLWGCKASETNNADCSFVQWSPLNSNMVVYFQLIPWNFQFFELCKSFLHCRDGKYFLELCSNRAGFRRGCSIYGTGLGTGFLHQCYMNGEGTRFGYRVP